MAKKFNYSPQPAPKVKQANKPGQPPKANPTYRDKQVGTRKVPWNI